MNYSKLKWVARGLIVVLAILGCCYVFDLILEGPSSIPIILISTIIAICVMVVVFELAIIIPMINWTQKQKISILRKREDYDPYYAPETKPELPGGPIKRKSNSYNKSNVRKPKTTTNRVTNNKKKS
jgi:hypothetical protein